MSSSLRDYRRRASKTLEEIGSIFGVHKTTVMRWEAGKIPAERVHAIAGAIGVSPNKLRPDLYPDADIQPEQAAS